MQKDKTSIFLEMIDLFRKLDVKTSMNYYAEDAIYRYGSFPPVLGKAAIEAMANSSHLDFIEKMEFNVLKTWEFEDTVIAQMELPHWLKDGRNLVIPCVDVVKFSQDGMVKEFLVYIDSSPLFQNQH